ncbi:putative fatty acid synthase alpha subunit FasA [Bombardia bombarda]|uniref:beta-ketoacyl-[acyl-carrier-protein] synthase I n=1 Tax=Bombardia bombarda TaxID=252184 RepID=A0AA39X8M1_9PEZI|nr:putative fatty acid synthase alpha subunit FasA [Bombardia bombarda]
MTRSTTKRVSPAEQKRFSEQRIAYNLLVELLTYQFAFPVQWIETQKALLASECNAQRIIEIGPAKVLASMAKKSAKGLVGDKDAAQSVEREFLSISDPEDARKIYYEYDQDSSNTAKIDAQQTASPVKPTLSGPPPAQQSEPSPVAVALVRAAPSASVDKDLTPTDVIITVVAQKLRRAFDDISVNESVQSISNGKSTLQNELIGDLAAEFGDLPDGSEAIAIEALGDRLASGFSGKPGKSSKRLIERFLSSKMPGGFGQTEVAAYLASSWGLGPNSQTAVQCFCVTMEPAARLSDGGEVHRFLDMAVARYAKHAAISLPTATSSGGSQSGGSQTAPVQVDSASLDALKAQQNNVLRKQLDVLAQHLGIEIGRSGEAAMGEKTTGEVQKQLDGFYAELNEEFLSGIQGVFDTKKERRYLSWWNWVREDVARLFQRHEGGNPASTQRLQSLANRWTEELENMLRYCAQKGPAQEMAEYLLKLKPANAKALPVFRFTEPAMAPHTSVDERGQIQYTETARSGGGLSYYDILSAARRNGPSRSFVHCLRRGTSSDSAPWNYDRALTDAYLNALFAGSTSGISYAGKTALVTGAGPGSIGIEVIRGLLSGGARVIATTSRTPAAAGPLMSKLYKEAGASGSELILLPFNAASKKDVESLVGHIYDTTSKVGLAADIDFVIPFAAISELGREIDSIDARSEVAHRAMLTNVLRLMGCIKQEKEKRRYVGRPTTVLLPLSPNHGDFGGDGLYSESKIGLETLFNRYHSEQWSGYLSVIGAVIGWTRGTGLMNANNIVAEGIEDLGVMTFTAGEMAFNILGLVHPSIIAQSDLEPVYADLSGGLMGFQNLKEEIMAIREGITNKRRTLQAVLAERKRHEKVVCGLKTESTNATGLAEPTIPALRRRSNIRQGFPKLSAHQDMTADVEALAGMVDLSRTVVIVGFSELGPWGSSRTRWQVESRGRLNQDGLTEMAWMMGLVKHHDGLIDGKPFVGWLDVESGKPVGEEEFATRYEDYIMKHCGIRVLEPESLDSYDPASKELLHEIVLDDDLPPFDTSETLAQSFKLRHGDKVSTFPKGSADSQTWTVIVKRGATFLIPKASTGHQGVAAQLPKGWNAATYGIPEDIISQVDPITLYVLCCVCEAMYSAGIEDPYELYQYIHTSELENCIGSGAGGLKSMRDMYRHRYRDEPVQGDILQETFLNSMAAWTNMLLFGATGPIKTPTGTCATSVESLDNACEGIKSRRVKVALVGGTDDLQEEVAHEFSNMKATMVSEAETAKGYLPSQMSRPTASSRAGFVESAGCGVQIVMSAELALRMGLPIYAIVAYTQMAGDNVSRSVPAPGQGVLTAARESPAATRSPLLDIHYRRSRLEQELAFIEVWKRAQLASSTSAHSKGIRAEADAAHKQMVESASSCRKSDAQWMWNGDGIRQLDPSIAPMRAALTVWGLTIDDIAVASFHGTSTKANDKNESSVINQQMAHLGRAAGNPLLVICQKHLTGHPKGGAGAWMLNGCLQVLGSGLVPGNPNADDVDAALRGFTHLVYPSEAMQLPRGQIKAFMLTSFGFGQKGGIVIGVTPRALFAALEAGEFDEYRVKVEARRVRVDRAFQAAMMTNSVVKVKEQSAWDERGLGGEKVFLDPGAMM